MFSIIDIINLIKPITPTAKVYPIEFPVDSPNSAVVIDISSTQRPIAKSYSLNVQVKVRDEHPSKCESTSLLIRSELAKTTNVKLNGVQVVLIEPINPYPMYIGKDGNSNYLYSINFRFLINEGV
jgi:hypothetical protein